MNPDSPWLKGWRRNLTAFACGVAGTLTLPPFSQFEFLFLAYGGLFWLVHVAPSRKRAFKDGWWWGWGYYMTGLYWFCIALLTDAERFAWLIPFTLFGLTAVIALYPALACFVAWRWRIGGVAEIFVFSTVWTAVEYARGHLLSGFPWNLPGYAFTFSDAAMQPASLVGIYGLSWMAVFAGAVVAAPALLARRRFLAPALVLMALGGAFAWGGWRLQEADKLPPDERMVPGVRLRLVQGNIEQTDKWAPELKMQGLQHYAQLTNAPGLEKVTHVVWPETAIPYVVKPDSELTQFLGSILPKGVILVSGGMRAEGEGEQWRVWNSMMAFDHLGQIVGIYDKTRLVPFGEFLPLRGLLPQAWLAPIGDTDFSQGDGVQTVRWPGLPPLSPLICYEVIFPESVASLKERPQLLLNGTNDAWFGTSSGPYQHFAMARMRAVEQGVPLVRVANTGITALVDSYGRVLKSIPLGTEGVIDIGLPKSQQYDTTYSRYSDYSLLLLIGIAALLMKIKHKMIEN